MEKLKSLFDNREKLIKEYTDQIFNSMPNVIEACETFIRENQIGSTPELLWHNVLLLEDEDLVILLGNISYSAGDTISLQSGEVVTFTEETASYFKAMIRLGVPIPLAEKGSVESIIQFLSETLDEEMEEINDIPGNVDVNATSDETTFNLDELTEEQKEAMEMYLAAEGMKGDSS